MAENMKRSLKKLQLRNVRASIRFHREVCLDGLTHLIEASEILKLFRALSIECPDFKLQISFLRAQTPEENADATHGNYELKGDLVVEVDLE